MFEIGGPDGPIWLKGDSNGYVIGAARQSVSAEGSPLIITVNPPIGPLGPLNEVDFGNLYQRVMSIING